MCWKTQSFTKETEGGASGDPGRTWPGLRTYFLENLSQGPYRPWTASCYSSSLITINNSPWREKKRWVFVAVWNTASLLIWKAALPLIFWTGHEQRIDGFRDHRKLLWRQQEQTSDKNRRRVICVRHWHSLRRTGPVYETLGNNGIQGHVSDWIYWRGQIIGTTYRRCQPWEKDQVKYHFHKHKCTWNDNYIFNQWHHLFL